MKVILDSMWLRLGRTRLSDSPSLRSKPPERVMVMTDVVKKIWRKERHSRSATRDTIGTRTLVALAVRSTLQRNMHNSSYVLCSVDRQVHLVASQLLTP